MGLSSELTETQRAEHRGVAKWLESWLNDSLPTHYANEAKGPRPPDPQGEGDVSGPYMSSDDDLHPSLADA